MIRSLVVLAVLALAAQPAAAQLPAPAPGGEQLVDRVVAVVGDTALLLSDLRTTVQQIQASGQTIPTDPAQLEAFMKEVLDDRINSLLLVEAAREAGTVVDESRISQQVEQSIQQVLRNFGTQQRLEEALLADGLSMAQYRELLTQQTRDEFLARGYMQDRMRARARAVISEDEIARTFETQAARLGTRAAHISFRQVVVTPRASAEADSAARKQAEEVYRELQAGGDWEVLARRFSDDPGSKENGGDLGWVRQGEGLVREFEQVAFNIRQGVISPIFRTQFGYHVLQARRTQGAERQIRHILIQPEITEADIERARVRADSVAEAIRGGANVVTLARAYGTPEEEIEIQPRPLAELPAGWAEALAEAQTGELVGPFRVAGPGADNWVVARVTLREAERPYVLDDVRDMLVTQLQENRMIEEIVADLRERMYVLVSM